MYRDKNCKICGTFYSPKCSNSKYCSKNCQKLGRNRINRIKRRKEKEIKICEMCKIKFLTSRSFQRFCFNCKNENEKQTKRNYYYNVLKPKYNYMDKGESYPQSYIYGFVCKFFNLDWDYNNRTVLKNPKTKYPLEIDIWCPEKKIAIEYDGEHHFKDKIYGKKVFKEVKSRDKIKERLCKKMGIKLIKISYKDPWKDTDWLKNKISEYM